VPPFPSGEGEGDGEGDGDGDGEDQGDGDGEEYGEQEGEGDGDENIDGEELPDDNGSASSPAQKPPDGPEGDDTSPNPGSSISQGWRTRPGPPLAGAVLAERPARFAPLADFDFGWRWEIISFRPADGPGCTVFFFCFIARLFPRPTAAPGASIC